MRRLVAAGAIVAFAVQAWGQAPLAITHVTVVDVTGGTSPLRRDMTVLTNGEHIVSVSPANGARLPSGVRMVDGRGKFLIPGLWDMHSHLAFDPYVRQVVFPLYVANGVTGIRDMAGDCFGPCADKDVTYNPFHNATAEMVHRWKRDIAAGRQLGPRIVAASAILDGLHAQWPGSVAIADTAQARAAVREALLRGADFIKVYSGLSRDAFLAIADESKRRGVPFAGHVPDSVSLDEAATAGQASMEHLIKVLPECSTRTADIVRLEAPDPAADPGTRIRALFALEDESFSTDACAPLFHRFVELGTTQVPTLTELRGAFLHQDSALTHDPRQQYMAPADTAWWHSISRRYAALMGPKDKVRSDSIFRHYVAIVGAMHRAGVPILAGTDVSNPWIYWGFSLHDELGLFVEAGLTPLAALQTATIGPARFLDATDSLGTIAPGKVADLVLLDANPLDDINNTRRIHAVVLHGTLIDSAARQRLLSDARGAAGAMAH